jgi:hypothetical protein
MYSTGAKSGERRRSIVTYHRDGDDYVVAATGGGSPVNPRLGRERPLRPSREP